MERKTLDYAERMVKAATDEGRAAIRAAFRKDLEANVQAFYYEAAEHAAPISLVGTSFQY